MIDYKAYKKACEAKSQWEKDRKNMQEKRRTARKITRLFTGDNDLSLGEAFKLEIEALGVDQAKKYLLLKHVLADSNLSWWVKNATDDVERIRSSRNEYRKRLLEL